MWRSPGNPFCHWLVWPLWCPLTPNWVGLWTGAGVSTSLHFPSWMLTTSDAGFPTTWDGFLSRPISVCLKLYSPVLSLPASPFLLKVEHFLCLYHRLKPFSSLWLSLPLLSGSPLSHQVLRILLSQCFSGLSLPFHSHTYCLMPGVVFPCVH